MKIMTDMEKTKAETVKTLSDVDIAKQDQLMNTLKTFYDTLEPDNKQVEGLTEL